MAGFLFKGELASLSSLQQDFICEVLKQRGFENNKINIEAVGKAGDNYLANVKRIVVESNGAVFKMIAKIAPTNEIARARSGIAVMFRNENVMYQEVLPDFMDLQQWSFGDDEDMVRYAKCYGVLKEPPHEMILLEDLSLSDFVILDRFKPLTNETVKLILRKFANLHALSYLMRRADLRHFGSYSKKLTDFFGTLSQSQDFRHYLANVEKDALEVLNEEKYKSAVRDSVSKMHEKIEKLAENVSQVNHSVVIQGDGLTNNIMFRLEDNQPAECIMIDYQLSKVSSPVCDLLYMIFTSTDHETRHKHYHEWIDYYYSNLDNSLNYRGMDACDYFPREELENDLKKYSGLYFDNAIMLFSIITRKSEDAAKVKEAIESGDNYDNVQESFNVQNLDEESVALFKSKIEGLVDSYREFGYIKEYVD